MRFGAGFSGFDRMKIAHVNFAVEKSIDNKIRQMARAAKDCGLPIDFVSFSLSVAPVREDNYVVYRLPFSWLGRKWAAKVQWPFRLVWAAGKLANQGYDVVVLRYPKLPIGWRCFLRNMSACVITEHHTNELAEIRGKGGFLRGMAEKVELRLRSRLLPRVQGMIGVTAEIADFLCAAAPLVPRRVLSNGIAVDRVPFSRHVPFDGKSLHMVFVASCFAPWHGLDRLLRGLAVYKGDVAIHVTLIGVVPPHFMDMIHTCNHSAGVVAINCVGPQYGREMETYYAQATIGVASLALFRNGMQQACTLKAREYIARGLPFVYAYIDPDVPDDARFAHRVVNDDSCIDILELVAFAERLRKIPDVSMQMRETAAKNLDWQCKVNMMHQIAVEICKGIRSAETVSRNECH